MTKMCCSTGRRTITPPGIIERSAELRTIFRELAKQLHLTVNPLHTPERTRIWRLAEATYEAGDVEKLKALQVAYEKEISNADPLMEGLTDKEQSLRLEVLKEGIKQLKEIEGIKNSFPFDIEIQVKDELWVKEEETKIEIEIKKLRVFEGNLIIEYESLFRGPSNLNPTHTPALQ